MIPHMVIQLLGQGDQGVERTCMPASDQELRRQDQESFPLATEPTRNIYHQLPSNLVTFCTM